MIEYRSAAAFDCSTWVATREQVDAELARLRKMLGILTAVVVAEAEAASAPEFEEALVAADLATWEKYDRDLHGDFECDPEPGDLVWVLTDEAVALRDLGRKAGGAA